MRTTREPTQQEDPLYTLYKNVGDLEIALQTATRRDPTTPLTTAQMSIFNEALRTARETLPDSRALKEDIDEAGDETNAASAYRQLHVTLVPTLHNALPEDLAAR